jgi:hypothetical protein
MNIFDLVLTIVPIMVGIMFVGVAIYIPFGISSNIRRMRREQRHEAEERLRVEATLQGSFANVMQQMLNNNIRQSMNGGNGPNGSFSGNNFSGNGFGGGSAYQNQPQENPYGYSWDGNQPFDELDHQQQMLLMQQMANSASVNQQKQKSGIPLGWISLGMVVGMTIMFLMLT